MAFTQVKVLSRSDFWVGKSKFPTYIAEKNQIKSKYVMKVVLLFSYFQKKIILKKIQLILNTYDFIKLFSSLVAYTVESRVLTRVTN